MSFTDKTWAIPVILAFMTLLASVLLSFSEHATRERIEQQKRAILLRSLHTIVTPDAHDNDLLASAQPVYAPQALGHRQPETFYRGTKNGKLTLVILPVVARQGYSGDIRLLVAIDADDGKILGTKILEHHETPGLGDLIEPEKSPWLKQFAGKSLRDPVPRLWKVRKDGGAFDQITGATITPRAVIRALKNALEYAKQRMPEWRQLPTRQQKTDTMQQTQANSSHE